MTKIDIVSNNVYLHHVLPEIVHWKETITSIIFISKLHNVILIIKICQT